MSESDGAAVSVRDLRVLEARTGHAIVDGVSIDVRPGELVGVVGESGSGKTTTLLSMLGYSSPGTEIAGGNVSVAGQPVLDLAPRRLRALRGRSIAYVAQNAGRALNPAFKVETSLADVMRAESGERSRSDRIGDALATVDLPVTSEFLRRLPHQLSGGQQQRVIIAMALSGDPAVVAMDEPTTGLDVVTQSAVIEEIRRLRETREIAIVYVSHDLAVVSQIADRIAVMYAGRIVEFGPAADVLNNPLHPYTRGLVQSTPDHQRPARLDPMPGAAAGVDDRPPGCAFEPRCPQRTERCTEQPPALERRDDLRQVACFHADRTAAPDFDREPVARQDAPGEAVLEVRGLAASHRSRGEVVVAARDIDIDLAQGECVALVGESGSGKTTIARAVIGLKVPDRGSIRYKGADVAPSARRRTLRQRRGIQYVFQDPFDALNPRRRIGDEIARTVRVLGGKSRADARTEMQRLLDLVRLPFGLARRFPHQLSGGERQRVAIARALASRPDVLICDEITSALDVSVQAVILDLLTDLRRELGLSMLLITHDLGVVSAVADRLLVLSGGEICESGSVRQVLGTPTHPYTAKLLAAAPSLARTSSTSDTNLEPA